MRDGRAASQVLYLTSDLGGGTGNHLLSMLAHLDTSRWHAQVVTATRPRARVAPTVPVEVMPPLRFALYPLAQIERFRQTSRICRMRRPDLVHAYFFWSILFARFLRRTGLIPLLVENREDQGFNWGRHEYAWLRATRDVPDRIVCVSEAVAQTVLEREGVKENRLTVIRNGIERAPPPPRRDAARSELGLQPEDLVVGMVANFGRAAKGANRFVECIPPIAEAVPEARFLLVGRGRNEDHLRRLAQRLRVEDRLVFAGFRPDIETAYAAMDLSVLTSLTEGLSITLLESMDHGLPVVATDVGGNREVVVPGRTGALVPPDNNPAFVREVIRLLRNPQVRGRMGEAARQRIGAEFQISKTASRYSALYEELLGTSRYPSRALE